jgi:hypothetical protein
VRTGHRIAFLVLGLAVAAIACGGKKDGAAAATAAPGSLPVQAASSPKAMAEAIGDIYVEAMTQVVDILKDRPDPAAVKPKIQDLKERTVQRLVEFGKKKESLSAADKAAVDLAVRMRVNALSGGLFSAFQQAVNYYLSRDSELFSQVGSFNIITQYADFDLLKKQAPEEAKRLGIE